MANGFLGISSVAEVTGGKDAGGLLLDPYGDRMGIIPCEVCGGVLFFGCIPPAKPGVR